ncbi:unnamed protein product [Orchesella dallaii]|uniref:Uncharacterized protein n=1 Tax=Orchesella dallaii TaxID=48710 RepID=A0ABP1S9R0_9HEXA
MPVSTVKSEWMADSEKTTTEIEVGVEGTDKQQEDLNETGGEGEEQQQGVSKEEQLEDNVPAQTARCFLRESFLRILWNLRNSEAEISFVDKPSISAEFCAFNREFDEAVVKVATKKGKKAAKKIDLISTSAITIDYTSKNGKFGTNSKTD